MTRYQATTIIMRDGELYDGRDIFAEKIKNRSIMDAMVFGWLVD